MNVCNRSIAERTPSCWKRKVNAHSVFGAIRMDKEDLHILRLMGEIDRNSNHSQRELSRRLDISLGLVNTFLKRLVNKGYFKVKTMPRNRVKDFLTPEGLARKSKPMKNEIAIRDIVLSLIAYLSRMRGSKASRKPSPIKLKARVSSASAIPGNSTMWGWERIPKRPSLIIAPQLGVGGLTPSPMKLSAASKKI